MVLIARYIHGSEDSTDLDVVYVVDNIPDISQCKAFEREHPDENINLIKIEYGIVVDCYKGTPDEINNSLYYTYQNHEQDYELLVKRVVDRDLLVKLIRSTRIILSHLSRTQYRSIIKQGLTNWSKRIEALKAIDLYEIDFNNLGKNGSGVDVKKTIAFQIGQVLALHLNRELYSKKSVSSFFEDLRPYLYRQDCKLFPLQVFWGKLITLLESYEFNYTEDGDNITFTNYNRTFNIKTEKEVK